MRSRNFPAREGERLRRRAMVAAILLSMPVRLLADSREGEVAFDPAMLSTANREIDLSRFAFGNPIEAGVHEVEVFVNGQHALRASIRFVGDTPNAPAHACFDRTILERLGVRTASLTGGTDGPECRPIDAWLPDAGAHYEPGEFALHLAIPQAHLDVGIRGATDPSQWEQGMPAARLNYSANAYRTEIDDETVQSRGFVQLEAGANLGTWRFRHRSTHHWENGEGRDTRTLAAYAQTDVSALRAQATLGDFQTDGLLFDTIPVRGVRLQTDDRMLPESRNGYAPVVEGIAHSNAVVTIRQNGAVIHEVNVPAGPFAIRDLYPTGYGGALDVTVTEADGSENVFIVPYASVVQLLREGMSRFSLIAGQWQGHDIDARPVVLQATAQRGVTNTTTTYAGFQSAEDYAAALLGVAINTRIGAFSLDLTNAWAQRGQIAGQTGHSLRLSYSHFLSSTDTTLMVAAHRHASEGYWSLTDQIAARESAAEDEIDFARSRRQFDLQASQPLGAGNLFASASLRNFWDRDTPEHHAQLSYAWRLRNLGLNLSGRYRENTMGADFESWLGMTLPLGASPRHSSRMNANLVHSRRDGPSAQMSVSGSAGRDRRLSYGGAATWAERDQVLRTNANAGFQGRFGLVNASAGAGDGQLQLGAGVEGGLVLHGGGLTATQPMSETIGIVHARGAAGARLPSAPGVRIDRRGYAVVPSLSPYRRNTVEIDPRGMPPALRFPTTTHHVVPTAGAVVPLVFETIHERSWLLRAQRSDGADVPFGARVRDATGRELGIFGQAGHAFLTGEAAPGGFVVEWGDAAGQRCHVADGHAPATTAEFMQQVETTCVLHGEEA